MKNQAENPAPEQARHIVQRMGETGQPPERGALFVNVGTSEILDILKTEYLTPMKESGRNSSFKLIQAPYGGGKTQFLMSLREVAWQEDFATARVGLSPKECPFDKVEKIYQEIAKQLELPPESPDEELETGLDVVLRTIVRQRADAAGADAVKLWLRREFEETPIESRSFRRAVSRYMQAILEDDFDAIDPLGDYLRGIDLPLADLKPFRIHEKIDHNNAFGFIKSLVQSLAQLELPGLVLLFDEMDRNLSLPTKRRREIADNLRQMIDHCGQAALPGVLWCYAVPPEFMDTIVPEYPALAQRLKGVARLSTSSPLQPIIDLDRLEIGTVPLMKKLGERLLMIYEIGFESGLDEKVQKRNVDALAEEYGARTLESGTRREFVKAAIRMLDEQARGTEAELDDAAVRKLAGATSGDDVRPLDGEKEFF